MLKNTPFATFLLPGFLLFTFAGLYPLVVAYSLFARALFGDTIPEIKSAMLLGRARLAPTVLPMPTRFRFYYDAIRSSHYHDIQATWFSLPFLRIHERNLDGHAILDLGILERVEDAPHTNRGAVHGHWGEVLAWVPSVAGLNKP